MDTSFYELKIITDQIYATGTLPADFHEQVVRLFAKHGVKLRQDDGSNPIVTISHPTSLPGSMVVGLRYKKADGTKTEDHFLFQPQTSIMKCYGRKLEFLLSEYKGTHKLQR